MKDPCNFSQMCDQIKYDVLISFLKLKGSCKLSYMPLFHKHGSYWSLGFEWGTGTAVICGVSL